MRMPRAPGPLLGRTQGVLWPWLLLLLAAGLPSLNAEVAASQPRFVQTADELRSALQDAAPHIELQSHLDLRDRPPLAESAGQSWPYLYRSYTGLQSLRGNCTKAAPSSLPKPSQDLAPGQCLIAVDNTLLFLHGGSSAAKPAKVWIDNLYLLTNSSPDQEVLHFHARTAYQRVWWTNIASEGAQTNSSAVFAYGTDSQYYIGDSSFLRHKTDTVVTVLRASTTMRLERATFLQNVATRFGRSAAVGVGQLAIAAVQNCTFDNDVLQDFNLVNGSVFADSPELHTTTTSAHPIAPLQQLPTNLTFLKVDDPDLLAIKETALQGRSPLVPSELPPPLPEPPTPTPPLPRTQPPREETSVAGPVAGGVAGGVVLLGALAVFAFWLTKRRKAGAGHDDASRGKEVGAGETAAGGAGPPMIVGNLNDTLASVPPSAVASTGAAGLYSQPSWMSGAASSAQPFHGAPSSMNGQGFNQSRDSPFQAGTASSGASMAPSMHPAAQPPSGWLQPPPVHGGVTTIYQLPSTAGSGGAVAAASMVATQRPAPALAEMMSAEAHKEQLERTLYTMTTSQPPELFMGQFMLMQDRRGGGQASVQFARGGDGGFFQYAIKFFNRVQDYAIEDAMYRNTAIKPVLPDLFAAAPNGDGAVRARSGYVFPPFLVMERGMTLAEWLQAPRDSLAVLSMFKDCAALLAALHAADHVHRDLKPDNILLMLQTQAWRLIDFGIAAPAGKETPPQCTLGYAAPEVIKAFDAKSSVTSAAAQDVWALGVMVFEAFTRKPAVDPFGGVEGCVALARGEKQYPWEAEEQAKAFGGSRARQLVESCLARDAGERPTAAALVNAISMISNRTEEASVAG